MLKVSPSIRVLLAMGLLVFAGIKVLSVASGLRSEDLSMPAYIYFALSFVFFHFLIFPKAMSKNALYIEQHPEAYPIYLCLRLQTWGIMLIMIGLGLGVRHSGYFNTDFIIGFYSGLGISLVASIRHYMPVLRKSMGW